MENQNIKRLNQMEPWIDGAEKKAMQEYMDSGGWLTEFKKTHEFEKMVADYVGTRYACAVNNGTISLFMALMALGIKAGDEVIVPDFTMIASANAVTMAGAKVVLVDVDPKNFCLDLEAVKKSLTPKTKAIMLVANNGRSPDMNKFVAFCRENKLFLIEDAAQALGSRYQGKHLGSFGDVGSFSFSTPKIITTGQGGILVTDNEELYKKFLKIKDFGRIKSGTDVHLTLGYNFKFTDLQSVIGIEQMKKLPWRVDRKKEMYRLYRSLLQDVKQLSWTDTNLDDTSPWFIDILVSDGKRDALASFLDKRGIGTRPFHPAIHTQPPYAHIKGTFPNSALVSQGLWLPSSSFLTDDDIKRVCLAVKSFFAAG